MMNITEINKRLKQRPPFQMVERVLELNEGISARGTKCVSVNEPHFAGHFPDAPIMPGVLIIEACAQLCSLVVDNAPQEDKLYVLLKVDNFKFLKPVIPGDVLDMTVTKTSKDGMPLMTFDAIVKVDGQVRVKGSLAFTQVDKDTIYGE